MKAANIGPLDWAGMSVTCPQCKRSFASMQGLINHLKTVHAKREHETKMTPQNSQD